MNVNILVGNYIMNVNVGGKLYNGTALLCISNRVRYRYSKVVHISIIVIFLLLKSRYHYYLLILLNE